MPPQGDNDAPTAAKGKGKRREDEVDGYSSSSDSSEEEGGDSTAVPVTVVKGKKPGADESAAAAEAALEVTHDMVHYCFEVLLHHLEGLEAPVPAFDTDVECPLFVTWEKEVGGSSKPSSSSGSGKQHHLRGCIGTLSPRSLACLKDYVYSSAFRDRRFSPIAAHEVERLKCSVSLLVQYEEGRDVYDWEVGVHGIIIAFHDTSSSTGQRYSATYLPEVAREQRWSKREALESLARKAGYNGKLTEAFWSRVSLTRYQSSKTSLTYADFVARGGFGAVNGKGQGQGKGKEGGKYGQKRRIEVK